MALAELLQVLEADAEARMAALLSDARADAERIVADGAVAEQRRRDELTAARRATLHARAAVALETARRDGEARVLAARADTLERIRRRATELLGRRAGEAELTAAMVEDLKLALEYLGPVAAVVEAPAPHGPQLRESVAGRADISFRPSADGRPGVVVSAADGTVTVDASLVTRLQRAWPRASIVLVRRIETFP